MSKQYQKQKDKWFKAGYDKGREEELGFLKVFIDKYKCELGGWSGVMLIELKLRIERLGESQ